MVNLMLGDCLERMKEIPDGSVDMILCDLPYGTTACKWDSVIPFEPLWEQYERVIKKNGAVVLFGSQPFTTSLLSSNMQMFRYEIIWEKDNFTNLGAITRQFGKVHENILVFYRRQPTYNPQMWESGKPCNGGSIKREYYTETFTQPYRVSDKRQGKTDRYPRSVIKITREKNPLHPTQKPVALFEYLIKTYTNEGETVLDNCMGSGTAGVAAKNTNRKFIGIEKDETYFKIAQDRIAAI